MSYRRTLRTIAALTVAGGLLLGPLAPSAGAVTPPNFKTPFKGLILIDPSSGQTLLEQNAETVVPPASLTKIMTLRLAYKALQEGTVKLDEVVTVSERAWAQNCPDCSVMFLEPGMKVSFGELLKGVAIASGNDACIAVAERISGTVELFVDKMNQEAQALGLKNTRFVDPHGLFRYTGKCLGQAHRPCRR